MVKAPYYDKNGLKKGAWSPEEDNKLRAYVERYGHWNWRQIPKFSGLTRCGKSCRLRWMNYLRPDVKRGNYSKEEEEMIIKLHEELGNKWSMIAAKLPGRTDNEIKNHWHTHLKKHAKHNLTRSKGKEQLSDASQCQRKSQRRDSEVESHVPADNTPSHHILESAPLSPETRSSDFSSMNSHHALPSGAIWAVDHNSLASSGTFAKFSGDFWTEPFLADSTFVQHNNHSPLLEWESILPYVSYHHDGIDVFWDLGL